MTPRRALVAVLSAVLLGAGCIRIDFRAATPRSVETVNVRVTCTGGSVGIDVDQWVVPVKTGGTVQWIVDVPPGSTARIRQKPGRPWAFRASEPEFDVTKGASAGVGRKVEKGKGRYGYDILVRCVRGPGDTLDLRIDPDIIIVDALSEVGSFFGH